MTAHDLPDSSVLQQPSEVSSPAGGRELISDAVTDDPISGVIRVVDDLSDFIPITAKELAAIEMFLGGMIDALVKSHR